MQLTHGHGRGALRQSPRDFGRNCSNVWKICCASSTFSRGSPRTANVFERRRPRLAPRRAVVVRIGRDWFCSSVILTHTSCMKNFRKLPGMSGGTYQNAAFFEPKRSILSSNSDIKPRFKTIFYTSSPSLHTHCAHHFLITTCRLFRSLPPYTVTFHVLWLCSNHINYFNLYYIVARL